MKLLDEYFKLQNEIYEYFGYKEDWKVIPLSDFREYLWNIDGDEIYYGECLEDIYSGNGYSAEIYTQRFLPKFVYEGEEFTMICLDTHCDGNKFLGVFTNSKKTDLDYDLMNAEEDDD